jgi:hypothetical protein
LAEVYFDERRYTDAESLTRRSASLAEAALGPDHPLVASSLHNLAAIYHAQGHYAKAAKRPWDPSIPSWRQPW